MSRQFFVVNGLMQFVLGVAAMWYIATTPGNQIAATAAGSFLFMNGLMTMLFSERMAK